MTLGPRPAWVLTLPALASALMTLAQPASGQTDAPKPDAGLERAQKAADAVFHWIKLNGDKGASRQPTVPAAAPAPAPVARKAAPAPAPVAAAPRPAPGQSAAPAPAQAAAPLPTAVAQAPSPASASTSEPAAQQGAGTAVLLASAPPSPTPDAPLATAAKAVEPPPPEEDDDEPLKLLSKVNPVMPRQLPPAFRKGFAQVQFTIDPNGQVSNVQVIKATHSRLGNSAVEAVKQWRFAPITKARNVAIEIAFSNEEG